jgi:hypothetical protein
MSGEARFESTIPLDSLRVLLDLGREFGFDPLSSVEMEAYFACLLDHSPDTGEGLLEWIRPQVAQAFRCLVAAPRWIQNPNWQLHAGRPMQFIGQLDVTTRRSMCSLTRLPEYAEQLCKSAENVSRIRGAAMGSRLTRGGR